MNDFFSIRYSYYTKRKEYLVSLLQRELELISNKVKFLEMIINEKLTIQKKKKIVLMNELQSLKFTPMSVINRIVNGGNFEMNEESKAKDESEESDNDNTNTNNSLKPINSKEYDYLLSMPLWNLTIEKIQKLKTEEQNKISELDSLVKSTEASLWIKDIDAFIKVLDEVENEEEAERQKDIKQKGKVKKIRRKQKLS